MQDSYCTYIQGQGISRSSNESANGCDRMSGKMDAVR